MERREFLKRSAVFLSSILISNKSKASGEENSNKQDIELEPLDPRKNIYLTIDDGPRKNMPKILENLGNNKVIFYLIGNQIKNQSGFDMACKALERGHILGNHSYSHPAFSGISFEKAKDEILKTEELIEKAYSHLSVIRFKKFFRFPYGAKKASVAEFLEENEYETQFWDIDSEDWKHYSKSHKSEGRILKDCIGAKEGDIVLTHDLPITAESIIPAYINSLEYKLIIPFAQDIIPEFHELA
ncbi:polysaccharide deacetylase family protein [Candidatus Pacearchaeota archaeon]|nr:polysaccharide deacetylase family protein [Candidatus Pacearchaeota archaeon]